MVLNVLGLAKDIGVSVATEEFQTSIIGDVGKTAESFTFAICDTGGIS